MKKRKVKKKYIIVFIILMAIISIFALVMILKSLFKSSIIGSWTTDGVTIYHFNKDNTGYLKVSLSEYEFKYKIEDDTISIDFDNERSKDTEYVFSIEKKKLVLKGKQGTFTLKPYKKVKE